MFVVSETFRALFKPAKDNTPQLRDRDTDASAVLTRHWNNQEMNFASLRIKKRNLPQRDKECQQFFNKKSYWLVYDWNVHYCAVKRHFFNRDRYHFCFPHCRHLNNKSLVKIYAETYSPTNRHTPDVELHMDEYNHDSWMEIVADISDTSSTKNNAKANFEITSLSIAYLMNMSTVSLLNLENSPDDLLWFEVENPHKSLLFHVTFESLCPVYHLKSVTDKSCPTGTYTIADHSCWMKGMFFIHSTTWIGTMTIFPKEETKCLYLPGTSFNASISLLQTGAVNL